MDIYLMHHSPSDINSNRVSPSPSAMAPNMMDAAPHDTNSSMMHNFPSESTPQKHLPLEEPRKGLTVGHAMTLQDPENPQNWPVYKKVYASVAGYAFGFTV